MTQSLRDQLLHLSNLYAVATNAKSRTGGVSLSGISTKIFRDGKTLDRVVKGGDVTTGSFEKAILWFSENWPSELEWPSHIPRPSSGEHGEAA